MSARDAFHRDAGQVDPDERVLMPCTRNADGSVTTHPERLVVTSVDVSLFQLITCGDRFVNHTCVECGFHAGLYVIAGRFVSLCCFCTLARIAAYRQIGADEVEPEWIGILNEEAKRDATLQHRTELEVETVRLDDLLKCGRCGALIQPRDARYYHAPGQNTSPPYCEPCAVAQRAEGGAGS